MVWGASVSLAFVVVSLVCFAISSDSPPHWALGLDAWSVAFGLAVLLGVTLTGDLVASRKEPS
jgi:hypothetical protein